MRKWFRRLRANVLYLRRPILHFLPLLSIVLFLVLLGGYCFSRLHHRPHTFTEGAYLTYCLIFMEHPEPFPEHWLLRCFYIFIPPLGMVVILDGIVRFSWHLLRKDQTSKEWVSAMAMTMQDHVIVCGLGKVGLRVLQQLLRLNELVVVLEKNAQSPNLAYARSQDVPVLIGTGREEGIFENLNVKQAKSIIVATDDDLANVEMALDARKLNPGIRVVLRLFDQELASKIQEGFGFHVVLSTSAIAAPLFATASTDRSIVNSFYVENELLVVANLLVRSNSKLAGKRIGDLCAGRRLVVLSHRPGKEAVFLPPADTLVNGFDHLVVQTDPATLKELHQLNNDPMPY